MEPKQPPPYPLRMPHELREKLEALAKSGGRSLNAEIVMRLGNSVSLDEVIARDPPWLKPRSLLEQMKTPTRLAVGELIEEALKPVVEQITEALLKDHGDKHPESKVPAVRTPREKS